MIKYNIIEEIEDDEAGGGHGAVDDNQAEAVKGIYVFV